MAEARGIRRGARGIPAEEAQAAAWPQGPGEMAERIRGLDWAATALGPVAGWPQSLRTAVDIVLAMPGPATLLWGPADVQLYNDAYVAIAKDRHPALLGLPAAEGWADVYETVLAPLLKATMAGRATRLAGLSVRLKGADGAFENRIFDIALSPVRDEAGRVAGTLLTLVETTGHHRAEAALRESEARFRAILGGLGQTTWEAEADGSIVTDSAAWRAYTGQSPAEWLGYGWLDAIHPDDRADTVRQWHEAVAARQAVVADYRLWHRASRSWRRSSVRAVPVVDGEGTLLRWIGLNIDVHEQHEAQIRLRRNDERRTFLLDLADRLHPPTDPSAIADGVVEALGRHLAAHQVRYAAVRPDGTASERPAVWICGKGPPGEARGAVDVDTVYADTFDAKDFDAKDFEAEDFDVSDFDTKDFDIDVADLAQLRRGATLVRDTAAEPCRRGGGQGGGQGGEADGPGGGRGAAHALVAVPLVRGGDLRAILTVACHVPHAWSRETVALIEEVAVRTWEAVERVRVEAALHASEARLAAVFAALPVGIGVADVHGSLVFSNADMRRYLPTGRMPSLDDARFRRWRAVGPDGQPVARADYPGARALRGETVVPGLEILYTDDDGAETWTRVSAVPLRGDGGAIAGYVAIVTDIDALKRTAEALGASEARQRALVEGIPQLVWRAAGSGAWTWASPQWCAYTGRDEAESLGSGWLAPLHPDDRDAVAQAWDAAKRTESFGVEHRIRRAADGGYRWFQTRAMPVRGPGGRIVEWFGTSTDVHDLRSMQAHQEVLVKELQHRARNLLAVVAAIADRTVRRGGSVEAFERRLQALSRAQGLLSRGGSDTVEVGALIRAELAAYTGEATEVVRVDGPEVHLRARQVQNFALAVHELATNAVKHGALRDPAGHLCVTWDLAPGRRGRRRLALSWVESRVAMPPEGTTRRGYGTELIQEALAYALQAEVDYALGADGVRCRIEMPIA